ncbi:VOC family protein [Kribbella sp. NPDC051587]|uniref:VOC family protein n=1 Tax=Kribbella sp. NPDC051587 TaxID=3364119 RepID=UPI003799DC3B
MSTTEKPGDFDQKVEAVIIAVSDVDRARDFYVGLGWRLDATPPGVVQLTPPGSATSIQFGPNLNPAQPGSSIGYVVVSDIVEAREGLLKAGADVDDYFHRTAEGFAPGLDPERRTYSTRARFADPDGNLWILQEVTTRIPGRVEPSATYRSVDELRVALAQVAATSSTESGAPSSDWVAWCAAYLFATASNEPLPTYPA